jgi:hypothetical protein
LTAFTDFWNSPGTTEVFTSAIMATRMVLAVIPTSLAGAAEPDGAAAADPDAADAVATADALLLLLLLEEELHPAASRIAATSVTITPTKRARLRICRPVPLRPGPPLLGLTSVPSTFTAIVNNLPVGQSKYRDGLHHR